MTKADALQILFDATVIMALFSIILAILWIYFRQCRIHSALASELKVNSDLVQFLTHEHLNLPSTKEGNDGL